MLDGCFLPLRLVTPLAFQNTTCFHGARSNNIIRSPITFLPSEPRPRTSHIVKEKQQYHYCQHQLSCLAPTTWPKQYHSSVEGYLLNGGGFIQTVIKRCHLTTIPFHWFSWSSHILYIYWSQHIWSNMDALGHQHNTSQMLCQKCPSHKEGTWM